MANFFPQLYPSPICCPQGAMAQNGVCYCTKELASSHPFACRVTCESLNSTLPPANGGCECPSGYAGEFCDQKPCYVYSDYSANMKFYCVEDLDPKITTSISMELVKDCNHIGNLLTTSQNLTSIYPPCPCFHGALKMFKVIQFLDLTLSRSL